MALWLIRAGSEGEHERKFLQDHRVFLTWEDLEHDLTTLSSREEVAGVLERTYPKSTGNTRKNFLNQIWAFVKTIEVGDWFAMPSKISSTIHFGEITSDCQFDSSGESPYLHFRTCKWIRTDVPRARFAPDLLHSMGAFLTICKLQRNNMEARIRAMAVTDWASQEASAVPPSVSRTPSPSAASVSKDTSPKKVLADQLFPEDSDDLHRDSILSVPPEQRRLHTETYDFSVSTLLDYLKDGKLFVPEFQRRYVWTEPQASRLVESLIIQCPIPVLYLNQEKDERLSVIDGNQRLTSLARFVANQFGLKGLTAYPELEGNRFFELDPRFQRHILNRTLRCIVILKDTHPQVKFDVFERLNTGAVKLTAQELRHGIYHGALMRLVERLARNKRWMNCFPAGAEKRMKAEEFVMRFFAFHTSLAAYTKPLSSFLNAFAEKHRELDTSLAVELEALFEAVADSLPRVYGEFAFKIFTSDMRVQSGFNAALFDAEVLAVSRNLDKAQEFAAADRERWLARLAQLIAEPEFRESISRATSDESLVRHRVSRLSEEFATF